MYLSYTLEMYKCNKCLLLINLVYSLATKNQYHRADANIYMYNLLYIMTLFGVIYILCCTSLFIKIFLCYNG